MAVPLPDYRAVDDIILKGSTDLLDVMRATREITDWSALALCLGIEEADFEKIQLKPNVNLHKEVIKRWFDAGNASWSELVRHLCDDLVNKQGLAQIIAQDHPCSKQVQAKPVKTNQSSVARPQGNNVGIITPQDSLEIFRLLKSISCDWNAIGRELGLNNTIRKSLTKTGLQQTDEDKLEDVLDKWIESQCSDVTWDHLIHVLEERLKKRQLADVVKRYLKDKQR